MYKTSAVFVRLSFHWWGPRIGLKHLIYILTINICPKEVQASGVFLLIKMQDLAMQKLSEYSLLIGSYFWLLVMAEMGCKSELLVGLHVWVKHLDIKKCLLSSASEVSGNNVNSCFILSIWCGIVHYFTSERLKWWFQTHIMADLCQEGTSEISDLIVADGRKCPSGTAECMVNSEIFTADTIWACDWVASRTSGLVHRETCFWLTKTVFLQRQCD